MPFRYPAFSNLELSQVEADVSSFIETNLQKIDALLDAGTEVTWEHIVEPLDELNDMLERYWSPISHLQSVANTDELRTVYLSCLPKLSEYSSILGQHEKLYQTIKQLSDNAEVLSLCDAQKQILKHDLRDFRLSGVTLDDEGKQTYRMLKQALSELSTTFSNNVLDATAAWFCHLEEDTRLTGIPEHDRQSAQDRAREKKLNGYVFDLSFPSYHAVVTYADDRGLREQFYRAYSTRASDQSVDGKKWDNSQLIHDILIHRDQIAKLLGFENYVALSLESKMAENEKVVFQFLEDLADRVKPKAQKEYEALCGFSKEHYGHETLEAWDIAYFSEKYRQAVFDFSQNDLRPYFPIDKVLEGLFEVANRLYGIEFVHDARVDVWDEQVRFYKIRKDSKECGGLYCDFYTRSNKRSGAWMDECVVRRRLSHNEIQLPIAFLTCNFSPPSASSPTLLTHEDVLTLFHEMGHCLHHVLTKVDYAGVSGINGVEWDAVELPSQFFENWCWQLDSLQLCSAHYETDEPMPVELFEKLHRAKNFHSALHIIRQLEFALFDLRLHSELDSSNLNSVQSILNKVRSQVSVVPVPDWNRFQNSFSHIFAGGYAAGYYSYLWAEVLSSDAFSLFEKNGIFDAQTGRAFLTEILEKGGSRDAMESFKHFRGREPQIDAFLKYSGIA